MRQEACQENRRETQRSRPAFSAFEEKVAGYSKKSFNWRLFAVRSGYDLHCRETRTPMGTDSRRPDNARESNTSRPAAVARVAVKDLRLLRLNGVTSSLARPGGPLVRAVEIDIAALHLRRCPADHRTSGLAILEHTQSSLQRIVRKGPRGGQDRMIVLSDCIMIECG